MKTTLCFIACLIAATASVLGQVDTTLVYKTGLPYGTLDIRLSKSPSQYYYLQENRTNSFRESAPGMRTNHYRDMTPWESSPYAEGHLREKGANFDNFVMNYRLLFPMDYNNEAPVQYPLIIVLHAPRERGNCQGDSCYWASRDWRPVSNAPPAPTTANHKLLNNDHQLSRGGLEHLSARNLAGTAHLGDPSLSPLAFPGFVLFPQNLNAWNAEPCHDVIRLIRLLVRQYKINPDRIYIEGLSDGGSAMFEIVKRAPWLFAGAVSMSGTFDGGLVTQGLASTTATVPFRIFQGAADVNPPLSRTTGYVNALRAAGSTVNFQVYEGTGHDTWTRALAEPDFFSWLLTHDQANIRVIGATTKLCANNAEPVTLAVHAGYRAYQWERDGATIAGATGNTLQATQPGIYRVRFSRIVNPGESDWNRWSDPFTLTEVQTATPTLHPSGTLLLPDPNNESKLTLRVDGVYNRYFWYKDNVLLDLPGNADDTTRHLSLTGSFGNGLYAAAAMNSSGCMSTLSAGKYVYFQAQAPVTIATPGKFKGVATNSSILLTWTDNANNESGYEIWRRDRISGSAMSPWKLVAVTSANANAFDDTGLRADELYHYKIRGISAQARSYYNPSLGFQLEIQTFPDATAPVVPVDTIMVYNPDAPYGPLDIRIAKSALQYFYLQENVTESFRRNTAGEKTNTYHDMTGWDSSPYTQGNLRERNSTIDNFVMNYRLLFPENYQAQFDDGYPLIVMMHGAGERGNCWNADCYWADRAWNAVTNTPAAPEQERHPLLNNDHNLLHGGEIHLQARNLAGAMLPNNPALPGRAFPGFVLFPQNLNGWTTDMAQDAIRLIRLLIKKHNIDPDRIYIHGLSDGGVGLYEVLKRAPWLFAAAAPMSAFNDAGITDQQLQSSVARIPFWIFQGGLDGDPAPAVTEFYAQAFRTAGADVKYTKYPNLGHGVWNDAYNEPDFFSWLRRQNQANIHVFANDSAICGTNNQGVRLQLPAGYRAYQWEYNGQVISGADAAWLVAQDTGVYRARFSRLSPTPDEQEWNVWSAPVRIREQHPSSPPVIARGTMHLPDMNNVGNVVLRAADPAAHYYWYKNGVLLNLPGNRDDTTRHARITTAMGSGVYTLVTSGVENCPSAPSEGMHIFVNGESPLTIVTPSKLKATPGVSTVALTWDDNGNTTSDFEIWRRMVTGSNTYTPWVLATRTQGHTTALADISLLPQTTYHYKIRAVSDQARSYYFPSSGFQVEVTTLADQEAPSAPATLTASPAGIQAIALAWTPATDNSQIHQYYIYYNGDSVATGSNVLQFVLRDLPLNTSFEFAVRAEDVAGNLGPASPAASGDTFFSGLHYEHSTGAWSDLDQVDWQAPAEYTGMVTNFTLAPRRQDDFFNFEFDGFIDIVQPGDYQFSLASDDGSRLAIDNEVIIDNDGLHGTLRLESASIPLAAGPHRINAKFFEHGGNAVLQVQYRGAATNDVWVNVPDSVLRSGRNTGVTARKHASAQAIGTAEHTSTVGVYPNPVAAGTPFEIAVVSTEEPLLVTIRHISGASVYESAYPASTSIVRVTQALSRGMYIVQVQQGARRVTAKLAVQ